MFDKKAVLTSFVAAVLSLGACAKKSADNSGPLGSVTVLSGGVTNSGSSLSGTGTVIFNNPLADGITSNNSYALAFTLSDGGSLTLHSNATNQVASALAIRFRRSGTTLSAALIAGGTETDVSSKFTSFDASGSLSFQIDVHNDETPAHVLIWSGGDFSEDAATLNSEDAGFEAPGNGGGSFWGLALVNAIVTDAKVGAPKFRE